MIARPREKLTVWLSATVAICGCAGDTGDSGVALTPIEEWVTKAEYEFGDIFEGDALFGLVVDVDVVPDGSRVYVLDQTAAEISVWTPGGDLIRRFGRQGEGPGEFLRPGELRLLDNLLQVGDLRGFSTFSLEGEFVARNVLPPFVSWRGFPLAVEALLGDGGFLAKPTIPGMVAEGLTGDDPIQEIPFLHAAERNGSWALDTIALMSTRNTTIVLPIAGYDFPRLLTQTWVLEDACGADGVTESVVCARTQDMPPGVVEMVEVAVSSGDTLWMRRFQLAPVPLSEQEVEADVERTASIVARGLGGDSVPSPSLKRRIRETMIVPEYWPAVRGIRLMSNGEVWFVPLADGESNVWYTARRGETEGAIRRIVLPEQFNPRDVNDTHVWGERYDELGVRYVVGRRLVRSGRVR